MAQSMVKEYVYSPHHTFYINKAKRPKGYNMASFHIHKKYELYYQVEGSRRYYVDDTAYLVNAGDMVILSPDCVHKTASVDEGEQVEDARNAHIRYVINFSAEYMEEFTNAFPDIDWFYCFKKGIHVLSIPPVKQRELELLLADIWAEHERQTPEAEAGRKVRLAHLLLGLNALAAEAEEHQGKESVNQTIDEVQSYISLHYRENLNLTAIAARFFLSPSYLSRLFKRVTSLSIVEYINSVRLVAAKHLLEATDKKVAQIAEETGFTTTTHFTRVFKGGTGMSPSQYRKYYHVVPNDHSDASSA